MLVVRVKGVANPMQFPDDMDINDIKAFLQRKFAQQAVTGNKPADLSPLQGQARKAEQSLVDKAGQGIGNALTSSGLVSNNFGAQEIGRNVASVGEFLPVIGDATAGDEFGKALAGGDGVGMALGALGAIPLVGDAAKKASDSLKFKFPDFKIGISENADNIILDKIVIPESQRGTGQGTEFMAELLADADSKGKAVGLTPSSDFGGNKKRLTEFYKRFGFIDNKGKNKDFAISESMIRAPSTDKVIDNE
jgi:predicted GNAT family acetyltransferase